VSNSTSPKYGTERGLRKLRGLVDVVCHLDGGVVGIHHVERDDGVDLQRDVVARDDVLRRNLEHILAQGDADNLIEWPEDQNDARPLGHRQRMAQAEDYAALVFAENLDGIENIQDNDGKENQDRG
jgi:hypothetical protein